MLPIYICDPHLESKVIGEAVDPFTVVETDKRDNVISGTHELQLHIGYNFEQGNTGTCHHVIPL